MITVQTPFGEVSIYERSFTEIVALCEFSSGPQFPVHPVPNPGFEILFPVKMVSETKEREVKIPSGYDIINVTALERLFRVSCDMVAAEDRLRLGTYRFDV